MAISAADNRGEKWFLFCTGKIEDPVHVYLERGRRFVGLFFLEKFDLRHLGGLIY
jgi:hypothetical protein